MALLDIIFLGLAVAAFAGIGIYTKKYGVDYMAD